MRREARKRLIWCLRCGRFLGRCQCRETAPAAEGAVPDMDTPRPGLRIVQPEPPKTRTLPPDARVPCRMGGVLTVRSCLVIRSRRWPTGQRKGVPVMQACIGCPLGEDYARRSPWFVPPPQTQPRYVLAPAQRAARAKAMGSWQARAVAMDPVREAAELTPDDATDWR